MSVNAIQKRFGKARVLLPVVHCVDKAQVRSAVQVALENGADGLWFINQGGMPVVDVAKTAARAAAEAPFVGVNLLGHPHEAVLEYIERYRHVGKIGGAWTDDARMHPDDYPLADRMGWQWKSYRRDIRLPDVLHFGGVAFKYQRDVPPEMWEEAAKLGATWLDVVTTSGPATGEAAPAEKLVAMRAGVGDRALALASGVTPENVSLFLPHVDAYLVASGIEERFGVFDPGKVKALADQIHAWRAP
jgi:hypothetical protein